MPETAQLIIDVRDMTRTDERQSMVLTAALPVDGGQPFAFSASVSKPDLIPGGKLVLRAQMQRRGGDPRGGSPRGRATPMASIAADRRAYFLRRLTQASTSAMAPPLRQTSLVSETRAQRDAVSVRVGRLADIEAGVAGLGGEEFEILLIQ